MQEDYIVDDILYCHVCDKPKEKKYSLFGIERKVPCKCECEVILSKSEKEKRELAEMKYRQSVEREVGILDESLRKWTFETVEMNPLLENCKKYVEKWDDMKKKSYGLLIYGDVGGGKTVAAACIANGVIDRGGTVFMTSFPKILNAGYDKSEIARRIRNADLVVIDDLGAERKSEYSLEVVYYLIDERYRTGKPLIITTNLTYDEIKNVDKGDIDLKRIYDRVVEMCVPFSFNSKFSRPQIAKVKQMDIINDFKGD